MTELESCGDTQCRHNTNGKCVKAKIRLVISYGRSTDYAEELQCEQRET